MRRVLKISLYTLGSILLLIILVVLWLNTSSGQNFVRGRAEKFLRDKLKTEVYIAKLGYGLPKNIVLEDVLFKDQAKDTLLAVEHLKVNINMLKLLSSKVEVKKLELWGVNAHIYRKAPDTAFNFQYIIAAFAGKPTENVQEVQKANDTSSLSFDVNELQLANIRFRFDDYTGGTRFGMVLDSLDLDLRQFDPINMNFAASSLDLRGLRTTVIADTSYLPDEPDDTTAPQPIQLAIDDLKLKNVGFDYNDVQGQMKMNYFLGNLEAKPKQIDLQNQLINIDKLLLQNTTAKIWMGKASSVPEEAAEATEEVIDTLQQGNWVVRVADIRLDSVDFLMDNDNTPRMAQGIDYAHLNVQDLSFIARAIVFTGDTIAGDIEHIALREQSGLNLRELRTNFSYHPQGAVLDNLYLRTDQTVLKDYLEVGWPSMEAMQADPNVMRLKVNLVESMVGVNDLLIFVPTLAQQPAFRQARNGTVRLDAVMNGFLSSLGIDKFYLAGLGNTVVNVNGRMNNITDPNKLSYDLNIVDLRSTRNDISGFLPREALAAVRIPDRFGARGRVAGGTMDYSTPGLAINTSDGNAHVNGTLRMSPGKGREQYDMAVRTENLNIGRILKDTMLGGITAALKATGRSFDINSMSAKVAGDIRAAYYNGYTYKGVDFTGNVNRKVAEVNLNSTDPNARLSLDGSADFNGKYPSALADINIDSINLEALRFYASELRARGQIHIDAPELNPDYPNALLTWLNPVIVANGQRFFTDSLTVVSRPTADSGQNITVDMDALQAKVTGQTPLTRVAQVVQEHIDRHYSTVAMNDTARLSSVRTTAARQDTFLPTYNLRLVADVRDRPILRGLLPDLEYLDTVHVDAYLDDRSLNLNATAPRIVYAGNTIENGLVTVNETDSALNYEATVDKFEQGDLRFLFTRLYGNIRNKTITANASIGDSARNERFALAAQMQQQGPEQVIQLLPGLKLDYTTWNVAQPNRIVLNNGGFYVQNFEISNAGQSLRANSEAQQPNAPMNVGITNFIIGNFTNIISKDTTLANGILNGNIAVERLQPSPQVVGDIRVDELSLYGDTLGNLALKANNRTENAVNVDMTLAGNGNDIGLRGDYYLKPVGGNSFDFLLGMRALNLRSFEGIAQNNINNSLGFIRGELNIKGSPTVPVVTGTLTTDNLSTTVSMLNSRFIMPNEKIVFDGSGINFQQFRILDSARNQAMINGQIQTRDFKDMNLDLRLTADNWQAVNSTKKDNDLFYGKLLLSTNLAISGTPAAPTVDGSLNILKGTDFTVVTPENDPTLISSEGIVQFYNGKDSLQYLPVAMVKDTTPFSFAPGSNINVNLGIDKDAAFSFIIDKATGDFVNVKGEAALNANVGNDGAFTLTGAYTIEDGAYMLNYNLIKRRFQIQKGSTVVFAGDPLDAEMNVTATYLANVPPYDLVERQVPDPSQLNYFKQRLPFDVQLMLRGQLLKPYISFNIDLPEDKIYRMAPDQLELVRSKLNQIRLDTSELTKQVFAVLLLNRFISDDPFSSDAGGGIAFTAKQSVSRFVGEQLNKFAGGLVKGVDLQVDLAQSEDYTTGTRRERTDLSINASKSLLNERLKITIGNDFDLSGSQQGNANQNTSYLPGNLAADYMLTSDGRYVVRAYRRNYDEGVLQGYITETGLNFIFSRDYNRFRQLFQRRPNAREQRRERREQRRNDTISGNPTVLK